MHASLRSCHANECCMCCSYTGHTLAKFFVTLATGLVTGLTAAAAAATLEFVFARKQQAVQYTIDVVRHSALWAAFGLHLLITTGLLMFAACLVNPPHTVPEYPACLCDFTACLLCLPSAACLPDAYVSPLSCITGVDHTQNRSYPSNAIATELSSAVALWVKMSCFLICTAANLQKHVRLTGAVLGAYSSRWWCVISHGIPEWHRRA